MLNDHLEETITAIVEAILREHEEDIDTDNIQETKAFVSAQLESTADYFRFGIKSLTFFFSYVPFVFYFKRYEKLDLLTKQKILKKWKDSIFGVKRDLIRFYEDLIILYYFENFAYATHEKG